MQPEQDEVFAFLASPAAWPAGTGPVEIIDTHGARVYLSGRHALKVKRAVKLPYLDFSTLEKRRYFCERELAINGEAAASLYEGVVAITRERDGSLARAGNGTPVEYGVAMHRFPEDALLANVVERGALTNTLAEAVADAIHRYHAAAPHSGAAGEQIEAVTSRLVVQIERFHDTTITELGQEFAARAARQVERSRATRVSRAHAGFVRRCHGDLHLGNIVLWQGAPVLFDALEFDEALATSDTMYDLAFLLMDLDRRGARAAANVIVNRYLWRSRCLPDVSALAALPLYLGLRAAIRAMVALDRMATTARTVDAVLQHARDTLALACDYLVPRAPALVAIGGLSGTGKTTLARALAPAIGAVPGALHVRSDLERKALAGVEPLERLPPHSYTKESAERVYALMLERAEEALKAGHAVIVDAVFASPHERRAVEALARKAGAVFLGLWLDGGETALLSRVAARRNDASDATPEVVSRQSKYDLGEITWTRIPADGLPQTTLSAATDVLAGKIAGALDLGQGPFQAYTS